MYECFELYVLLISIIVHFIFQYKSKNGWAGYIEGMDGVAGCIKIGYISKCFLRIFNGNTTIPYLSKLKESSVKTAESDPESCENTIFPDSRKVRNVYVNMAVLYLSTAWKSIGNLFRFCSVISTGIDFSLLS